MLFSSVLGLSAPNDGAYSVSSGSYFPPLKADVTEIFLWSSAWLSLDQFYLLIPGYKGQWQEMQDFLHQDLEAQHQRCPSCRAVVDGQALKQGCLSLMNRKPPAFNHVACWPTGWSCFCFWNMPAVHDIYAATALRGYLHAVTHGQAVPMAEFHSLAEH